ncbi:MAG: hypothetical protein WA510_23525 [Acidobacteriaceae bacterium]
MTRSGAPRLVCFLMIMAALLPVGAQNDDAAANQKKARATLDAMVAALGGQRWLTLVSSMGQGRTSGFYQGKPTGATAEFYEFQKFPDQTRIELGKKRDVVDIISGDGAWEITYKGKKELPKDQLQELLRRRDHSIRTVVTSWLNDPKTILIYGGQNLVERHLADQTTLINSNNDSVTIQTDAETHLPLRRSYQWRDPVFKDKNTDAEEYDDYHTVDGLPTPFTVTRFHNDDMTNQRFLYRAAYGISLTPDMFNPDQTAAKIKK